MKKKKILITGGAGYLGTVLSEKLAKEGLSVRIFDRFYFGRDKIRHLDGTVESVEGDIRKPPADLFDGVDSIIHLAALSNDPTAEFNPAANRAINTLATKKLAKMAKQAGVKRFIFASSCSIYDLGMENGHGVRSEVSRVNPKAAYSLSKHRAEKKLIKLAGKKFDVVILRKGTVFGFSPRMRYDLVVNTMVKNALSSGVIKIFCRGVQWRPLVDIEDAARAYAMTLTAPSEEIKGQIFNISLGNFLVRDLASVVSKTLKKHFKINPKIIFENDDKRDRSYSVSGDKAKKILGFVPKVSIEESIVRMVKGIRSAKMTDFGNPIYYNIEWMRPILGKGI